MIISKKSFKIPIYGGMLTVYVLDNISDIQKKYNLIIPEHADACLFRQPNYSGYYVIAYERSVIKNHGIIAHEALHFTHKLLDDRAFTPDFENDEVECYLIEWAINNIHKVIKNI